MGTKIKIFSFILLVGCFSLVSADNFAYDSSTGEFAYNRFISGGSGVTNGSTLNVNNSQYLQGYQWANAPYPSALYSTYNSTYDAKVSSQWVTSGSDIYYNSGNIGMGVDNPTTRLDILGDLFIRQEVSNVRSNWLFSQSVASADYHLYHNIFRQQNSYSTWYMNRDRGIGWGFRSTNNGTDARWAMRLLAESGNMELFGNLTTYGGADINGTTIIRGNLNWTGNLIGSYSTYNSTYDAKVSSQWVTSGSDIYYNSGNVAIGGTNDFQKLNVFTPSGTSGILLSPSTSNVGMFLSTDGASRGHISAGMELNGSVTGTNSWIARGTSASSLIQRDGIIQITADSGLTYGSAFTPTEILRFSNNKFSVGGVHGSNWLTKFNILNTGTNSGIRIATATGESGLTLGSQGTTGGTILAGAEMNKSNPLTTNGLIARSSSSSGIIFSVGDTHIYGNSGLSVGTQFTPTTRLEVEADGDVGIGTVSSSYPLEVRGTNPITIYAENNISATGFITRTSIYETSKEGSALSKIKPDTEYLDSKGDIDHSKFYGYTTWTTPDYTKPMTVKKDVEICNLKIIDEQEVNDCLIQQQDSIVYPYNITHEGVNLEKEINLLRQALYELKVENENLKQMILDEKEAIK